jgi:hypothetical protein
MSLRSLLTPILDDDRLTHGLGDAEARMLIEWLAAHAEAGFTQGGDEKRVHAEVQRLCGRARAIARFVSLWCHERSAVAALQLAATERFRWPLPVGPMNADDLMHAILTWENETAKNP